VRVDAVLATRDSAPEIRINRLHDHRIVLVFSPLAHNPNNTRGMGRLQARAGE
jgi:hypothetical protein